MRRTALVTFLGAILSFVLAGGGHWLLYSLVSGTHETHKDDYIQISILQMLVILPSTSLLVGALVGSLLPYNQWRSAVVCLLPLIIYLSYQSRAEAVMVLLCLIYLGIGRLSALLVSRSRLKRRVFATRSSADTDAA